MIVNVWKYSTIIWLAQVAMGMIVYILSNNDIALAVAFVVVVAMLALAFAVVAEFPALVIFSAFTALAIAFAMFAFAFAMIVRFPTFVTSAAFTALAALAAVFAMALAVSTAQKFKDKEPEESFFCLLTAALPLGIGTILGGIILIARHVLKSVMIVKVK